MGLRPEGPVSQSLECLSDHGKHVSGESASSSTISGPTLPDAACEVAQAPILGKSLAKKLVLDQIQALLKNVARGQRATRSQFVHHLRQHLSQSV